MREDTPSLFFVKPSPPLATEDLRRADSHPPQCSEGFKLRSRRQLSCLTLVQLGSAGTRAVYVAFTSYSYNSVMGTRLTCLCAQAVLRVQYHLSYM